MRKIVLVSLLLGALATSGCQKSASEAANPSAPAANANQTPVDLPAPAGPDAGPPANSQ